jgi:CRISPR-associated protein (TIGR02584 family)
MSPSIEDPAAYPRRILLAVTGLSPQIVTETVYALAVKRKQWVPSEIRIITTQQGAAKAQYSLLRAEAGWFHRLRADYDLPAIAFGTDDICIISGPDGKPLADIRDAADNVAVADFITEQVRELTADPTASLHVSIAGGRKTMGFYVGYALSLFGRPQDRLSHVLVPPPYESLDEFFYPAPHVRPICSALDASKAAVYLGEIPFVRLRDGLPERLLAGNARFSEAVAEAQKAVPPVALYLEPSNRVVVAGGEKVDLKPAEFAFYLMLAERRRKNLPGAHWSDKGLQVEIAHCYSRVVNPYSGEFERFETAGMSQENFHARKSHTNGALLRTLGKRRSEPYLIEALAPFEGNGRRRLRPYGLLLPPEVITIANAPRPNKFRHRKSKK